MPKQKLHDGADLQIREAAIADTRALLGFVEAVSAESDFLTFGPGEFKMTMQQEADFITECQTYANRLYIIGLIDDSIVAMLHFAGGNRPRVQHSGEISMAVQKNYWGLGIGSLLMDSLIEWAQGTGIIKKLNLRVREDNQRAIMLFKKKDFQIEGTLRREIYLNSEYYDIYWMGREL